MCGRLPCCSARLARGARVVGRRTVDNAAPLARVRLDAPLGLALRMCSTNGCASRPSYPGAPFPRSATRWRTSGPLSTAARRWARPPTRRSTVVQAWAASTPLQVTTATRWRSKSNLVHLLASESTGALSRAVILLLKVLAKSTQEVQGHDSTPYGIGRASSPRSFFPHHLAAVSSAIVRADALAVRNNAAALAFSLAHGIA